MRDASIFMRNDFSRETTFERQRKHFKAIMARIEELLREKEKYDDLIREDNLSKEAISFKSALNMYKKAKYTEHQNIALMDRILEENLELHDYIIITHELDWSLKTRNEILSESIDFSTFGAYDGHYSILCHPRHGVIKDANGDLVCLFCGATTKDYLLSKEDKDFLLHCAKAQGMLLDKVTERDLPLLKLLIEEKEERLKTRIPLDEIYGIEEDPILGYMGWAEEYYLEEEAIITDLEREVAQAHELDNRIYTRNYKGNNPAYLTKPKVWELLTEINRQIKTLENSVSDFKDLQIEICRTYWYEVMILYGITIRTLYNNAKTEDEKVALVKAYYNLSNPNYRINSGYFSPEHEELDACNYYCRTAHPEINQRILEMKIKR